MSTLKQKTLFIFSIIVFFVFGCKNLEAGVVINEVQILPIENRFIELYNNSDNNIDLSGYYLQRKTPTGNSFTSIVTSTTFEGLSIKSKDFLILSKESLGIDSFTITESNLIQLKSKDQGVVYKIGLGDSTDCGNACVDNPSHGKSIQRISDDNWVVADPTPGEANAPSLTEDDSSSEEDDSSSSSSSSGTVKVEKKKEILNPSITTKIIIPKTIIANVPFTINHQTIGYKNEKRIFGRFVWNFGNGDKVEVEPCMPFEYTYQYPGDYALSLSYYDTDFSIVPEAMDRVNVKVIPSGVKIVSVGSYVDPYIELENDSNQEMVLNKWSIVGANHTFVVPDGMVILPNKKIKLSPKITGFDYSDLSFINIRDEFGTVFATYPKVGNVSLSAIKKTAQSSNVSYSSDKSPGTNDNLEEREVNNDIIDLNNLKTSAYDAKDSETEIGMAYLGLFFVVALGVVTVILLGKSTKKKDGGEDNLSADDIKIME